MKSILITGGAGFVGKSLSEKFKNNYDVFTLRRADLDLLNQSAVKVFFDEHKIDMIFHCANQGGSRLTGYDTATPDVTMNNLKMFFNLQSCLKKGKKLVTFGSGACYNKQRDLIKVREHEIGDIIPEDAYGFSKLVQHKLIGQNQGVITPIIFGLFGKNEDYRFKFISNAIVKNLMKLPIVINQNVVFDYLYIEDFLNIMDMLIENDYDLKSFNISPVESIDLISISGIINDISGYKSEIIVKNKGLNFQYTGDNRLMLQAIAGYKFMTYRDSVSHLYDYYKSIIGTIDRSEIVTDEYIKYCRVNR